MRSNWKIAIPWLIGLALAAYFVWPSAPLGLDLPLGGTRCTDNLGAINRAVRQWERGERLRTGPPLYPPSLQALAEKMKLDPQLLICGVGGAKPEPGKFISDYDSIFDRSPHPIPFAAIKNPSAEPMVWDKAPVHGSPDNPCRNVLYMDGRIDVVPESQFRLPAAPVAP